MAERARLTASEGNSPSPGVDLVNTRRTAELAQNSNPESVIPLTWLYFCSGIPALIYQTIWQRILVLHTGVGTTSVAVIVSAYMVGLGVGSLIGARLSRVLSPTASLTVFAILEILIGLCGVVSPYVLYDLLYLRNGSLYADLWTGCLLHFAVLILPTSLMGMTLPLMTRALVRSIATAARSVGTLYGMNMVGAAFGAVLSTWILMPLTGVTGTVSAAVAANGIIALLIFWGRSRSERTDRLRHPTHEPTTPVETPKTLPTVPGVVTTPGVTGGSAPLSVWLLLYFLGGMCAIGLEIVWFRILDIAVKSTSYTFGTVLGVYLFSMAMGSIRGAARAGRSTRPFRDFLVTQCIILISAGIIVLALVCLPVDLPGYRWYVSYWASEEPLHPGLARPFPSIGLYLVLPLLLMGIPTWLMGYSFCLLQKGIQKDPETSGYRVGLLQGANILGCTLGSLMAGLWLLSIAGSMLTLRVILASGFVFGLVGMWWTDSRKLFGGLGAAILAVVLLLPSNTTLWLRLHGRTTDDGSRVAEDITGVCALTPQIPNTQWWMWANGKTQSLLPFGGFHTKLGVLPVTLHPQPRSVAIIGLGSGDTAWAAACRSETQQVTVFEICRSELSLLQEPDSRDRWPQVRQLLDDPRVRIDGRDARFVLMTEETRYDVIEADAIRPQGAFSGYLYSVEFFRLCSQRLNPGGYMCSWSPTPLVHATFRRAFPHVLEMENGLLLIGSNDPIESDLNGWQHRIETAGLYLGDYILNECLNSTRNLRHAAAPNPADWVNTDLFPYDEFN